MKFFIGFVSPLLLCSLLSTSLAKPHEGKGAKDGGPGAKQKKKDVKFSKFSDATTKMILEDGRTSYTVLASKDSVVTHLLGTNVFSPRTFKFDPSNEGVSDYIGSLKKEHMDLASEVGLSADDITYHHVLGVNGFTALMSPEQARNLQGNQGVRMIEADGFFKRDQVVKEEISSLNEILKNDIETSGSPSSTLGYDGEGIVVGIVSSGIWPEHPSFADDGSYPAPPISLDDTIQSACDFGNSEHNDADAEFSCNNKLIGARKFLETRKEFDGLEETFDSARDGDGDGTFSASIAAGNTNVDAMLSGEKVAVISGVAHRAHVVAYKAGTNFLYWSDLVAAIDQAIADGVDILDFPNEGYASFVNIYDLAILGAVQAGIYVSTIAGNGGPGIASLASSAGSQPWITTAAATETRVYFQSVMPTDELLPACWSSEDSLGADTVALCRIVSDFSSRGPNELYPNIIKPDVTATGNFVLGGASPYLTGELFAIYSERSFSCSFITGIFALLKQANPDWSPAESRSAIMTTANKNVLNPDLGASNPFMIGSGHVDVNNDGNGSPTEPGLVYDIQHEDYLGILCANFPEVFGENAALPCDKWLPGIGVSLNPLDLNYPSIGISSLIGSETVKRTITSVADGLVEYEAILDIPEGYELSVEPTTITLSKGASVEYSVTVVRTTASYDVWSFGAITWKDTNNKYEARSPIAVYSVFVLAPDLVEGSAGSSGSLNFGVIFGFTGDVSINAHGLEPAVVTTGNVVQDPDRDFDPDDGFSNEHQFELSGAAHFRIEMPPEATEEGTDIDLFVYDPTRNQVAFSFEFGTDELIDISFPMDGTWSVFVHGWEVVGGDSDYSLYTWVISATPGGNLAVTAPGTVVSGQEAAIDLTWSGANVGEWHFGAVSYSAEANIALTLVEVDNR